MKASDGYTQEPILTLKNLYRLLTQKDYPIHSYRVFPEQMLRGESLLTFWHSFFLKAFPQSVDLEMFDPDGKRNRNLSRLMNRSGSGGLLDGWFTTLSGLLNDELFLSMVYAWQNRLEQWRYNSQALEDRLAEFAKEINEKQDLENTGISAFLLQMTELPEIGKPQGGPDIPVLFRQSVTLTWMTLIALYGTRQSDVSLNRLWSSSSLSIPILYRRIVRNEESSEPEVISTRQCVLCIQPLSERAYFGYREELEATVSVFGTPGIHKLIVNGIGGTGKTEFVRQLLARLVRCRIYEQIAFVQYEENFENSIVSAFPSLINIPAGERIREARGMLERSDCGKTLLLIDNVNQMPAQDSGLQALAEYGCDVIITSRFAEFEGFDTLHLNGLDPENGRRMFAYYLSRNTEQPSEVDLICRFVACHPMALRQLASLCRFRFWSVETLRRWLEEKGLASLSYIRQASPVNLEEVFADTFDVSCLTGDQLRLMRMLSLFSYSYWLPAEIFPYAGDICRKEDYLTDLCVVLSDLGWLQMSNLEGFAVHPLIAEVVRLQPVSADDYPALWNRIEEKSCGEDEQANRLLISLILRTAKLNSQSIRCLARLEQNIGFFPYISLPNRLYEIHRQYLDTYEHSPSEEADYWLSLGIRDLVVSGRRDRLNEYIRKIRELDGGLRCVSNPECRNTLLEHVSAVIPPEQSQQYFDEILPEDPESVEMADYLISWSVKQRRANHDPEGALKSLEEANRILARYGFRGTMKLANADYRRTMCLMDLGRAAEARPLIEEVLRIIREQEGRNDTVKAISTRNTYATLLIFLKDYEAALHEFKILEEIYRKQRRNHSSEYIAMRNNIATLLDSLHRYAEAEKVIMEVLEGDKETVPGQDVAAIHLRNAALILCHNERYGEAEEYIDRGLAIRKDLFENGSPWIADAQAVHALVLYGKGKREEAEHLITEACRVLNEKFGPSHRHTMNAESIREIIRRQAETSLQ